MDEPRVPDSLWRDTLLTPDLLRAFEPPAAALRVLRRRRRLRQAVPTVLAAVLLLAWFGISRWSGGRGAPEKPTPSIDADPSWIVHTRATMAEEVVRTKALANIVTTSRDFEPVFVVRSGPGRYSTLSDEALLAMLADRAPALVGAPGERRLILLGDDAP
jgi:hypothetical protein